MKKFLSLIFTGFCLLAAGCSTKIEGDYDLYNLTITKDGETKEYTCSAEEKEDSYIFAVCGEIDGTVELTEEGKLITKKGEEVYLEIFYKVEENVLYTKVKEEYETWTKSGEIKNGEIIMSADNGNIEYRYKKR